VRVQDEMITECQIRQRLAELLCLPIEERRRHLRTMLFEWHPDKNPDRESLATRIFQLIQSKKKILVN